MPDADRQLVRRALDGDHDAFGALLERYSPLVHGVVLERVRSRDEAEDLVQDVFVRAHQHLADLRDGGRFAPWIGRIAANVALDAVRRRHQRARAHEEGQLRVHPPTQPDEEYERDQAGDIVWRALDRIPLDFRRVVVLYYVEGCRQANIARFLGITVTTVKWRLYRARTHLHEEVTALLGERVSLHAGDLRRFRDRALAVLPLLTHLRPPPPPPSLWSRLARLAAAATGVAGVVALGFGLRARVSALEERRAQATPPGALRVRYQPQSLPALSVVARPPRPRPGTVVEVEVAGLPTDAGDLYLHYTASLRDPDLRVVPLVRHGEAWLARVPVPDGATNLFYHPSGAAEPDVLPSYEADGGRARTRALRAYAHGLLLYGDDGLPVQDAHAGMADLHYYQGHPYDEQLAQYSREVDLYPRNADAYKRRWGLMRWGPADLVAGNDRARWERQALLERFPGDADLAWETASHDTIDFRDFRERFPDDDRAALAAYPLAIVPVRDHDRRAAQLRRYVHDYPAAAFTADAYRDLLHAYDQSDTVRSRVLADSLIDGSLRPHYDPEQERSKPRFGYMGTYYGLYPSSAAFISRFRNHLARGDTAAAEALARRLLRAGLDDPMPYLALAEGLQGRPVAQRLLEHAATWATTAHMETLPGFLLAADADPAVHEHKRKEIRSIRYRLLRLLGGEQLQAGNLAGAEVTLGQALDLQERLSDRYLHGSREVLFRHLARLHERLGRCAAAVEANERILGILLHDPDAEAALQRLYGRGCGTERTPAERLAALWPATPAFCAESLAPEQAGADSLCLTDIDAPVIVLYRGGQLTAGAIARLERLRRLDERFGPRGLAIVDVAMEGTIFPGDGGPGVRERDRVQAAMVEHDWPFTMLISEGRSWPEALQTDGYGSSQFVVIDADRRLRLRVEPAWSDTAIARQDSMIVELLEEVLPPAGERVAQAGGGAP